MLESRTCRLDSAQVVLQHTDTAKHESIKKADCVGPEFQEPARSDGSLRVAVATLREYLADLSTQGDVPLGSVPVRVPRLSWRDTRSN